MFILVKNNIYHRKFIITFFIGLFFFVFISNPFDYYFLNDDFIHIPKAAKGELFQSHSLLRPVSEITLWIDSKLWGKSSYGFHISNILIHIINVFFVFIVSKALYSNVKQSKSIVSVIPYIASTLFLLYSFHSESIYWIIGRGASLTTMFFLCAFYFFLSSKRPADKNFFFCLVFFVLGLLTYELIWVFPLVLLVFFFLFKQQKKILLVITAWMIFILYLLVKVFITDILVNSYGASNLVKFDLVKLIYNINTLIARSFLPPMKTSSIFLCFYVVLLCLLGFFLFNQRNNKLVVFYFISFIVSLMPTISLGIDTHDSESERFIYLASFFLIMLLVEVILSLDKKAVFPIYLLFSVYYSIFLFKSANSYKLASAITKLSLSCLEVNKDFDTIYLNQLPNQYKGALIFRLGFPEALKWINNTSFKQININSTIEIVHPVDYKFCIDNFNIKNQNKFAALTLIQTRADNNLTITWKIDR